MNGRFGRSPPPARYALALTPEQTLSLDFGPVSGQGSHPFAVALDAAPFEQLLDDARNAHRIYELALLQRPGDLWEYLEVIATEIPPAIIGPLELARSVAAQTG